MLSLFVLMLYTHCTLYEPLSLTYNVLEYEHTSKLRMLIYIYYIIMYEHTSKLRMLVNSLYIYIYYIIKPSNLERIHPLGRGYHTTYSKPRHHGL